MKSIDERLRRAPFRGSLAVAAGAATEHQLRSGRFVRLVRDVYVVRGHQVDHALRCRAASMIAPRAAVLTGRSAAVLRGEPLAGAWDPVELAVPEDDRFGPVRGLLVRRVVRAELDALSTGELRIASPARMVFDLASRRELAEAVADLDQVVRAGLVDQAEVTRVLELMRERDVRRARLAWSLVDGRAESRPESRLRLLLGTAGLHPVPQLLVRHRGEVVARVDLGFEQQRVAVEYDGVWHADAAQLRRDRRRLNRLREAGWTVVFVTWDMLTSEPHAVVRTIRAALRTPALPSRQEPARIGPWAPPGGAGENRDKPA